MTEKTILDVSRWQGTPDWAKVAASGQIDGVMLRVLGSKGGKPYLDPQFERNYAECTRLGLPVGVDIFLLVKPRFVDTVLHPCSVVGRVRAARRGSAHFVLVRAKRT